MVYGKDEPGRCRPERRTDVAALVTFGLLVLLALLPVILLAETGF